MLLTHFMRKIQKTDPDWFHWKNFLNIYLRGVSISVVPLLDQLVKVRFPSDYMCSGTISCYVSLLYDILLCRLTSSLANLTLPACMLFKSVSNSLNRSNAFLRHKICSSQNELLSSLYEYICILCILFIYYPFPSPLYSHKTISWHYPLPCIKSICFCFAC